MGTVLTGDLIEPWAVTNPLDETTREETLIGGTGGDIEIERDPNVAEWEEHMNEFVQSKELQDTGELTIEFSLETELGYLLDAQLFYEDTDNGIYRPNKNVILDGMEFACWDKVSDADPSVTYRCLQVRPQIETTFAASIDDRITLEATYHLMGPHGYVTQDGV